MQRMQLRITEINDAIIAQLDTLQEEECEIDMTACPMRDDRIFAALGSLRKIAKLDLTNAQLSVTQFSLLLKSCHNIENLILTNSLNLNKRYGDPDTCPTDHPRINAVIAEKKKSEEVVSVVSKVMSGLRYFGLLAAPLASLLLEDKSTNDAVAVKPPTELSRAIKEEAERRKSLIKILSSSAIEDISFTDSVDLCKEFGAWLAEDTTLQSLTFTHNIEIYPRGSLASLCLDGLIKGLKQNKSIHYLDLSANGLEYESFDHIASLFSTPEHPPIHTLLLNDSIIGNNSHLASFATLVSSPYTTIQSLSIDESKATRDMSYAHMAAFTIISAMKASPNHTLTTLNVRARALDDDFEERMVKTLKELLQTNRTLTAVNLGQDYPEIEALLAGNREAQAAESHSTPTIRM